jgi:hypothetical protein
MTLTVFQVGIDHENSQLLDAEGVDLEIFAPPANRESVAGRSWPSTLSVFDPSSPSANFYFFHESFLVMDTASMMRCRAALDRCGEFIPLNAAKLGSVNMYNTLITLSQDAVDWSKTKGTLGIYSDLTLNKKLIPPASIFRLPKISSIYLSTNLDEDENDFFYLYRKHALSGLYFKKLWDEIEGPVPRRSTLVGPN